MESDEEFPKGLRIFCGIMGVTIMILVGVLIIWSFDWTWTHRTKYFYSAYKIHDDNWFKYIFYPATAIGEAIGLMIATLGLPRGESKATILFCSIIALIGVSLIVWAYTWSVSFPLLVILKWMVIIGGSVLELLFLYGWYIHRSEKKS